MIEAINALTTLDNMLGFGGLQHSPQAKLGSAPCVTLLEPHQMLLRRTKSEMEKAIPLHASPPRAAIGGAF